MEIKLELEINIRGKAKRNVSQEHIETFRNYNQQDKDALKKKLLGEVVANLLTYVDTPEFDKKFNEEFENKFRALTRQRPDEIPYMQRQVK